MLPFEVWLEVSDSKAKDLSKMAAFKNEYEATLYAIRLAEEWIGRFCPVLVTVRHNRKTITSHSVSTRRFQESV